jgi:nitroreductase
MQKPTQNNFPILNVLSQRWSPRAYSDKPVEHEKLQSIFEAARWAPSARNEQPWRFILGQKGDGSWEKIFESLVEWNQQWTAKAPVLVINLGKKYYDYKHLPNDTYQYDTGQAVAMMVIEAVNQGLIGHQMSGFSAEKAMRLFQIPDDYHPISVSAFGYYGDPELLPLEMNKSEFEDRIRRPLKDTVFANTFAVQSNLF